MYTIAKLDERNRDAIFTKYAYDSKLNKAIVEKDFWVTIVLDYLFHKSKYKEYFIFKGGTSLSKCFHLIQRFSEDIDLILKWNILTDDNPNKERSNRQQDMYNKNINLLAQSFIKEKLVPAMVHDFHDINKNIEIIIDENDGQIINLYYPRLYDANEAGILKYIRLEIGPLAALSPTDNIEIFPLISKMKMPIMNQFSTKVETVLPQRTFLEKILILHQEAYRPMDKKTPKRYSRHYYDIFKISMSKYKDIAYNDLMLLTNVREFKKKFYPVGWAQYDLAKPGTFRLVPSKERIKEFSQDFLEMKEMLNDNEFETFEELVDKIRLIEKEINSL